MKNTKTGAFFSEVQIKTEQTFIVPESTVHRQKHKCTMSSLDTAACSDRRIKRDKWNALFSNTDLYHTKVSAAHPQR